MNPKQRIRWMAVGMVLAGALIAQAILGSPAQAQVISGVIDLGGDGGGVAVNPNTNRVYVAVAGKLNVYDAHSHALITSISLPQNYTACYDVAVNVQTNRVYAVGFRTYVVDGDTDSLVADFDISGNELALNPATNRIYIATSVNYPFTDPYVVHVLDGAGNSWLPDIPIGSASSFEFVHLGVNPNTNRVYATFTGDDNLRVLDGNSHAELARINLPNTGYVVVDPVANRVYAGINYVDAVVLDGISHAQVGTLSNIGMGRLALNQATGRVYGLDPTMPGYVLRIFDTNTYKIIGYVHLNGNLEDYDLHPQLGKLFATHDSYPSTWGEKMTIIQDESPTSPAPTPKPPALIATLDLPEKAYSVGVNSMTDRLYVGMEGTIAVFEAASLASLGTFDLTDNPDWPPISDIGVDETRNWIFAVSEGQTFVVDGVDNQVIGNLGSGDEIAINPNNGRVYIVDNAVWLGNPDVLRIYDSLTMSHIRTIKLGTSSYYQWARIVVNPGTGYAYCTYSLGDDLHIISPTTDDIVQTIDYTSIGDVVVNPAANRVYVWISRAGKSGALVLDGDSHSEVGMIEAVSGQLEVNPRNNRLYGETGATLFQGYDLNSGEQLSHVYLDGDIRGYAVATDLMRLYAVHHDYPEEWSRKVSVIQDTATPFRINLPLVTRDFWEFP